MQVTRQSSRLYLSIAYLSVFQRQQLSTSNENELLFFLSSRGYYAWTAVAMDLLNFSHFVTISDKRIDATLWNLFAPVLSLRSQVFTAVVKQSNVNVFPRRQRTLDCVGCRCCCRFGFCGQKPAVNVLRWFLLLPVSVQWEYVLRYKRTWRFRPREGSVQSR